MTSWNPSTSYSPAARTPGPQLLATNEHSTTNSLYGAWAIEGSGPTKSWAPLLPVRDPGRLLYARSLPSNTPGGTQSRRLPPSRVSSASNHAPPDFIEGGAATGAGTNKGLSAPLPQRRERSAAAYGAAWEGFVPFRLRPFSTTVDVNEIAEGYQREREQQRLLRAQQSAEQRAQQQQHEQQMRELQQQQVVLHQRKFEDARSAAAAAGERGNVPASFEAWKQQHQQLQQQSQSQVPQQPQQLQPQHQLLQPQQQQPQQQLPQQLQQGNSAEVYANLFSGKPPGLNTTESEPHPDKLRGDDSRNETKHVLMTGSGQPHTASEQPPHNILTVPEDLGLSLRPTTSSGTTFRGFNDFTAAPGQGAKTGYSVAHNGRGETAEMHLNGNVIREVSAMNPGSGVKQESGSTDIKQSVSGQPQANSGLGNTSSNSYTGYDRPDVAAVVQGQSAFIGTQFTNKNIYAQPGTPVYEYPPKVLSTQPVGMPSERKYTRIRSAHGSSYSETKSNVSQSSYGPMLVSSDVGLQKSNDLIPWRKNKPAEQQSKSDHAMIRAAQKNPSGSRGRSSDTDPANRSFARDAAPLMTSEFKSETARINSNRPMTSSSQTVQPAMPPPYDIRMPPMAHTNPTRPSRQEIDQIRLSQPYVVRVRAQTSEMDRAKPELGQAVPGGPSLLLGGGNKSKSSVDEKLQTSEFPRFSSCGGYRSLPRSLPLDPPELKRPHTIHGSGRGGSAGPPWRQENAKRPGTGESKDVRLGGVASISRLAGVALISGGAGALTSGGVVSAPVAADASGALGGASGAMGRVSGAMGGASVRNVNTSARSDGALATVRPSTHLILNGFGGSHGALSGGHVAPSGARGTLGGIWREGFEAGARSLERFRTRSSMGGPMEGRWGSRNTGKPWSMVGGEPWNPYEASAARGDSQGGGGRSLPDFSVLPKRSILKKGRVSGGESVPTYSPAYSPQFCGPAPSVPRGGVPRRGFTPPAVYRANQYTAPVTVAPPSIWLPANRVASAARRGGHEGGVQRVTSAGGGGAISSAQGLKRVTFNLA